MTSKTEHVAARGLCYTPVGAKEEVRVEAGEAVTGMSKEMLKTCIGNGKVVTSAEHKGNE